LRRKFLKNYNEDSDDLFSRAKIRLRKNDSPETILSETDRSYEVKGRSWSEVTTTGCYKCFR
jgi:hypothetical protein